MKRIFILLLATVMAFCFAACEPTKQPAESSDIPDIPFDAPEVSTGTTVIKTQRDMTLTFLNDAVTFRVAKDTVDDATFNVYAPTDDDNAETYKAVLNSLTLTVYNEKSEDRNVTIRFQGGEYDLLGKDDIVLTKVGNHSSPWSLTDALPSELYYEIMRLDAVKPNVRVTCNYDRCNGDNKTPDAFEFAGTLTLDNQIDMTTMPVAELLMTPTGSTATLKYTDIIQYAGLDPAKFTGEEKIKVLYFEIITSLNNAHAGGDKEWLFDIDKNARPETLELTQEYANADDIHKTLISEGDLGYQCYGRSTVMYYDGDTSYEIPLMILCRVTREEPVEESQLPEISDEESLPVDETSADETQSGATSEESVI